MKENKKAFDSGKKEKAAKPLVLIPFACAVGMIVFMVVLAIVSGAVGTEKSEALDAASAVFSILTLALPLPCIASAAVGIVFAAQARKEEKKGGTPIILLGVISIAVFAALVFSIVRTLLIRK